MTDKLTDNEIIKALECCKKGFCGNCQRLHNKKSVLNCMTELNGYSLDLINRLQAKNTELLGKIEDLEANRVELLENIEQLESVITQIKTKAYKEFAYDLKQIPREFVYKWEIENLLKEKVGEETPLNDVKCIDCEYLELELPYAVCSKAHKGIVQPNDSCGMGKLKEKVGNDDNRR